MKHYKIENRYIPNSSEPTQCIVSGPWCAPFITTEVAMEAIEYCKNDDSFFMSLGRYTHSYARKQPCQHTTT